MLAIDERRLAKAVQDAADAHADAELVAPMSAWEILADPARFPRLVAFLESFEASSYRVGYQDAKRLLEVQAGITRPAGGSARRRPATSSAGRAESR